MLALRLSIEEVVFLSSNIATKSATAVNQPETGVK